MVSRKGLQPHFQSVTAGEALFVNHLLLGSQTLEDPTELGMWLHYWLNSGLLRAA